MDDDDYNNIKKKPLKLKSDKKKAKKKQKFELCINTEGPTASESTTSTSSNNTPKVIVSTTTKAEEKFRAKQEMIAQGRILKKASKTHKQRVEEFNKHLDSLSEHYDIPKVSWTK